MCHGTRKMYSTKPDDIIEHALFIFSYKTQMKSIKSCLNILCEDTKKYYWESNSDLKIELCLNFHFWQEKLRFLFIFLVAYAFIDYEDHRDAEVKRAEIQIILCIICLRCIANGVEIWHSPSKFIPRTFLTERTCFMHKIKRLTIILEVSVYIQFFFFQSLNLI